MLDTKSSFCMKLRTAARVQLPFSRGFVLVLARSSYCREEWARGCSSMKFRDFPDIS